jgi:hypothetical protein
MGYRSQVGLVVQVEDFEGKLLKEAQVVQDLVRILLSEADDIETDDGFLGSFHYALYRWNDIKWYDEYVAVEWIEKYRNVASETTSFIRLGEEVCDLEEEHCTTDDCPFHLGWSRKITW